MTVLKLLRLHGDETDVCFQATVMAVISGYSTVMFSGATKKKKEKSLVADVIFLIQKLWTATYLFFI